MVLPFKIPYVDFNGPKAKRGTINTPNVFTNTLSAITATLIYRDERRLPQPNLIGASGSNNSTAIQVSTASAGQIIQVKNSAGVVQSFVQLNSRPLDV